MFERSRLFLLAIAVLLQVHGEHVLAQSFNGSFEDSMGNFDLSGWTWDCEDPAPDLGYMSYWSVKKLTAVTGVPPGPCTGVTLMQHPIPDSADASYLITGWAYVDDPNMSASIGFAFTDGLGSVFFQGDFTNSTIWDYLSWPDVHSFFQGHPPQASLDVSDGFSGYGYGHFDGLELTITPLSTGVIDSEASTLHVSLSPDGAQLAIPLAGAMPRSIRLFDVLGRLEIVPTIRTPTSDPLIIDVTSLAAGLHLVVLDDGQRARTAHFVKR